MSELRFVGVEWHDPHSIDAWTDFKDLKKEESPLCRAMGYVIDESKRRIVLSPAVDPNNDEGFTNLVIPKGCILKIIEADDPWVQEEKRKKLEERKKMRAKNKLKKLKKRKKPKRKKK